MQHAQKSAPKSKSKGRRRFRLKGQAAVVQLQFPHGFAQLFVILCIYRINTGKYHGFYVFKPMYHVGTGIGNMGKGVAHLYLFGRFNARNNITHIACQYLVAGRQIQFQNPYLIGIVFPFGGHEFHFVAFAQAAVHDSEIGNNAPEGIEYRVEYQRLQGGFCVPFGWRYPCHNRFQYLVHAQPCFARGRNNVVQRTANQLHNLVLHLFGHGRGQIHFI